MADEYADWLQPGLLEAPRGPKEVGDHSSYSGPVGGRLHNGSRRGDQIRPRINRDFAFIAEKKVPEADQLHDLSFNSRETVAHSH